MENKLGISLMKCKVCNRKLTSPESVERQMGEVCYKKWLASYRGVQTAVPMNRREGKEQRQFLKRLQQDAQK